MGGHNLLGPDSLNKELIRAVEVKGGPEELVRILKSWDGGGEDPEEMRKIVVSLPWISGELFLTQFPTTSTQKILGCEVDWNVGSGSLQFTPQSFRRPNGPAFPMCVLGYCPLSKKKFGESFLLTNSPPPTAELFPEIIQSCTGNYNFTQHDFMWERKMKETAVSEISWSTDQPAVRPNWV